MMMARKLTPLEKAAEALAVLSDVDWQRVKLAEDRRRSEQRAIRDLIRLRRELRGRKEPAR